MANFMPFQFLGSRFSLCLTCSVMALPLMFSMAGMTMGVASAPRPMVMASGMGESMWAASNSPANTLSRTTAQPAVRFSVTFKPSLA